MTLTPQQRKRARIDGIITADMLRAHALRRLRERYSLGLNEMEYMERAIRLGYSCAYRLAKEWWAQSVWRINHDKAVVYVVWDDYLRAPVTFLPPESRRVLGLDRFHPYTFNPPPGAIADACLHP